MSNKEMSAAMDSLLRGARCVDLGHTIRSGMPVWQTHESVAVEKLAVHDRDGYYNQRLRLTEHSGTHVDASAHMHGELMEQTIDRQQPDALLAPAVVYDLRPLGLGPGQYATLEQVLDVERRMDETVGEGEIALFSFGWDMHWNGEEVGFASLNAPGLEPPVCRMLLERGVRAAGSDTMAFDTGMADGVAVGENIGHSLLLRGGILLIENLKNLTLLPPRCFFMALPLKTLDGSGSPVRPIAFFCGDGAGEESR